MKKIGFVLLHYRDVANTKACIDSLCAMVPVADLQLSIYVIDNNSPDPFPSETISHKNARIYIVRNTENLGYTGGMNSGIVRALKDGSEYVAVLNNDTIIDKHFLTAVAAFIREKRPMGILVPKIYFYPGSEFHYERYKEAERGKVIWYAGGIIDWDNVLASHNGVDEVDTGQFAEVSETTFATGCCIIFPKEILDQVGMFDDRYYLYYEDIDLSMRIKRAGYRLYFIPDAIMWHKNAKSSGGSGSLLQEYFITRNRMLFAMKYAPYRAKLAILREGFSYLFRGRTWQKRAVVDFFLQRLGKGTFRIEHAKN